MRIKGLDNVVSCRSGTLFVHREPLPAVGIVEEDSVRRVD